MSLEFLWHVEDRERMSKFERDVVTRLKELEVLFVSARDAKDTEFASCVESQLRQVRVVFEF